LERASERGIQPLDVKEAILSGNSIKELPLEARDHNLIGNHSGFKEFHIGGDLLVVYCIEDDIVRLTRIGSHSRLFK
jgi:addiction module RelE/StbE family toxin